MWPSSLTSGYIYPKERESGSQRSIFTPTFTEALLTTAKIRETTEGSVHRWMGKEDAVYIYSGVLFRLEKEENPAICDNKDGLWGHYVKWKKSEKDKYCYDITCM